MKNRMKKFSWYTIVHPDYEGWPAPPIYRLVGPSVEEEILAGEYTNDIYFKPNRKGGYNRKDSHLLNVEGKNLFGKRWTKIKKHYNPKLTLFNGMPKRFWLKLEISKIYFSMMSFSIMKVINEISQMMLNMKKQDEKKQER